jgi:MFS transporter, putative metabolite:H+ symporter
MIRKNQPRESDVPDIQAKAAELIGRLERLPFSRWHLNLAILASIGVLFDAADFALFGAALPPIAKEFGLGPAQAGLLATLGLVGAFVGALFWGTISDYIGRRRSFEGTIAIFTAFTALTAVSWSLLSLGLFRFLSNFGLGGQIPVALTITSEFMPGRLRGRVSSSVLAAFPLGLALAAGLSLVLIPQFGWRILFAVGIAPVIMLFFVRRFMPESVRFLISRGRMAEAEQTVETIERAALPAGQSAAATARTNIPTEVAVPQGVTVFELVAPGRRRTTLLLWVVSFCFFWSSNGILFMLPTILTQRGIPLSQAISFALVQGIFGVIGYSSCGFLIDRFGRRPILFLYFFVGAAFHLWFAMSSGVWMYVAIAFVGWVNPGVYGPTGVYVGELHPTHLRATAIGWFFGIGRIGSFMAPAIVGFMLASGMGQYVLYTFALTYLIASFAVIAIGIETKGMVLEQITGADGPTGVASAAAAAVKA